ncbi:TetR/AcrR family transcriptional regulator [Nocardiopsis sp. RSe5-2]|uniref:TetR/AcrR family transcriptional regulator n=1 Tax=Nocardiopsis endophytica TaxID=3018445 RepID=A0ABT4UDF4_9ACTN|nr:TetR/AcrR family transcriptional regulator [Nocardiopsis endophytica]MDA2814993.1 TetR/AcrR family transcriptional regulator [Nocardiopsis endophytica]
MTTEPVDTPRRPNLSREKVLRAAVAMADEDGKGAPSVRALAKRLGVEAMSLYHHFRNKDLILDGMVDLVFAEVEDPQEGARWRTAMRGRAASMRAALVRHPWALGLMDSRTSPGPATLRRHDAAIGCLRSGGFSVAGAAHALSVLDGYTYGFTLQQLSLPFTAPDGAGEVAGAMLEGMPPDAYPHLAEMIGELALKPGYTYTDEFETGLDLILDGLELRRGAWA